MDCRDTVSNALNKRVAGSPHSISERRFDAQRDTITFHSQTVPQIKVLSAWFPFPATKGGDNIVGRRQLL